MDGHQPKSMGRANGWISSGNLARSGPGSANGTPSWNPQSRQWVILDLQLM